MIVAKRCAMTSIVVPDKHSLIVAVILASIALGYQPPPSTIQIELGERALGFSDVIVGRQPICAHVSIYRTFSLAIQSRSREYEYYSTIKLKDEYSMSTRTDTRATRVIKSDTLNKPIGLPKPDPIKTYNIYKVMHANINNAKRVVTRAQRLSPSHDGANF